MHLTPVDLQFTDANGRKRVLNAVTINGYGWYLRATLDGHIFSHQCSDWQGVELTLRWLKAHAHDPAARRPRPRPPRGRTLVGALAAVLLLMFARPGTAQILQPTEEQAILQFQRNADQYAFLHRRIERRVGPIEVNADPETIRKTIELMAWAMRDARPDARQGDIITPDAEDALRARIARAMRRHTLNAGEDHAEELLDAELPPEPLKVNGTFPWRAGTPVFPCLIEVLPQLPPELMYRIVGRDLVLVDIHASLIVDMLPYALAESTFR